MNDLPVCLSVSKSLLFIDDTKIYNIATNPQDHAALQNNLDLATSWSEKWDMYFNPTKAFTSVLMQRSVLNTELLELIL